MFEPSIFSAVQLDTSERSPASPKPPRGFEGLLLRAPTRITVAIDDDGRLLVPLCVPVCGFHCLEVPRAPISEIEQLVLRPQGQAEEYRGPVVSTDPSPEIEPPPAPPHDPNDLAGLFVDTYFNADLAVLVDFPREAGAYDLWFEFRGHRSNMVSFELVFETQSGPGA